MTLTSADAFAGPYSLPVNKLKILPLMAFTKKLAVYLKDKAFVIGTAHQTLQWLQYFGDSAHPVVCVSCEMCHALKSLPRVTPRAPLRPVPSGYANQRLSVDIIGIETQLKHGNVYLLVMVDFFSI